jgi:phosphate starvation-inducible PhoH-like protein
MKMTKILNKLLYILTIPTTIDCFRNTLYRNQYQYQKIFTRAFSAKNNDVPKLKSMAPQYKPKTPNQVEYVKQLNNPNTSIILGIGEPGTGKTLFACVTAIEHLKKGKVDKIILTRPIVPVEEEELGFLPGNLVNKMNPWTRPILDIFGEFFHQHEILLMLKNEIIEISPLAFMRGRTFKNCFIICDEMQNSSPNQMLMLTTRIGTNSKMVITGDLKQSDRMEKNGLKDLMYKLKEPKNKKIEEIKMIELNEEDIERSKIVKIILEIYQSREPTVPLRPFPNQVGSLENYYLNKKDSLNTVVNDAALIPKTQLFKQGTYGSPATPPL